ncbi:hypothetical protein PGT21_003750 [Puccinia graminis f. sp. tritici]|uniref:Superoxide dismutase copper/zinc binding domain-containing protein n=1 Tax=Puccinia graminis f. sp. tritici TaxID=56615 RepID=A0A5B0NMJ7_PUCGR|nr:hypothetical protein PGTUg99_032649 [Puccinia graminis f. sp. tritici]KAA1090511.1 hypothetical protein PGT21_003750 [Puccinia graminis f. sp. tritici]
MNLRIPNSANFMGLLLFGIAFVPDILRAQPPLPPTKPPGRPPTRFPCTEASVLINGLQGITGTAFFKPNVGRNRGIDFKISLNGLQRVENHKYHVHEFALTPGGGCKSAGKNFNPTKKPIPCPANSPQSACAIGDLSAKGGSLKPATAGATVGTEYLDTVLKFSDIQGRSLVIHDQGGDYIACGDIVCKQN